MAIPFTPGPCFGVERFTGYGVGDYGSVKGEDAMMREIYARGPIACSAATDDLFVYNYSTNAGILAENVYVTDVSYTIAQIDHVMEVAGWGTTQSGLKYWVVRNSWGTYWGDMGWVKIRRGVNQQQIEYECGWAIPDVEDVENQLTGQVLGDYIHGVTVKQTSSLLRRDDAPTVQSLAVGRVQNSFVVRHIDVGVALVAGTVGVVLGVAVASIARGHRSLRQPSLLG